MATNLVSQIIESTLGPTIVSRIASSLGLDQSSTQKAINAAMPGLLAALIAMVSKPQGASKLADVVAKQPAGVLSSLADVIGGAGQKAFIDKGSNTLSSLLGGPIVSSLASGLGRYAGIGEGGSKSLLGLLGPAALGVLGHAQRERGLDASGLASLLTSQKDEVVAAMPSGFSKYLSEAGILDDVTSQTHQISLHGRQSPQQNPHVALVAWRTCPSWCWSVGLELFSGRQREVVEAPRSKDRAARGVTGEAPYAGLLNKLRGIKVGDVDIGELATSAVNDLQYVGSRASRTKRPRRRQFLD